MRKKWLKGINVLLGAMSVALIGCKHGAPECLYGPPPEPDMYGCPPDVLVEKYGVPPYLEDEPIDEVTVNDTIEEETNNTTE